jgi:hypothetical protein
MLEWRCGRGGQTGYTDVVTASVSLKPWEPIGAVETSNR